MYSITYTVYIIQRISRDAVSNEIRLAGWYYSPTPHPTQDPLY